MKKEFLSRTVPSKGNRQNWTPFSELKAVKVTESFVHGKVLNDSDLKKRSGNDSKNTNNYFLVP